MRKAAFILAVVLLGGFGLAFLASRPVAAPPNTAHLLGITNGAVSNMATTYQAFSTNTAATVAKWRLDGTNAVILRVTNHQRADVVLSSFARVHTNRQGGIYESILLNAENFSGVVVGAGEAVNVQVLILGGSAPWRVELGYIKISDGPLNERLLDLPRGIWAWFSSPGVVTRHATPIYSEWVSP